MGFLLLDFLHIPPIPPSDAYNIMDGHRLRVFALQYNPNHPHVFISGGWDDTVQVINMHFLKVCFKNSMYWCVQIYTWNKQKQTHNDRDA